MINVMITGANGQLGNTLCNHLASAGYKIIPHNHFDGGIENREAMEKFIDTHKPHILINTAAFHQVDQCEQDIAKAGLINTLAPKQIAAYCKAKQIQFVHFSTDYVFDGNKKTPYLELDQTNPLNIYGKTKAQGEKEILIANTDAIIIRVSGLFGHFPCRAKNGLNFVQVMLKKAAANEVISVVNNEWVSPTYCLEIARQIPSILQKVKGGIVHCSSEGSCTWYEFAKAIFEIKGIAVSLQPTMATIQANKIQRPAYSVMENGELKRHGINQMNSWREGLKEYLNNLG